MTNIAYRNTVLGFGVESVEGTPVAPTGATQFLAIQDDLSFAPSFNTLENAEKKSSIGQAKKIIGSEAPTVGFSHYMRASGVEGQAPNFRQLLKSFFGNEVVASTEYDTTSGSTVAFLRMPGGEGANFQRGQPLLIKDGVNGYRIRFVHSKDTDDLNLSFNLPNAPASGVNTGKAAFYTPASTGHQTLTMWNYLGNDGAVEMVAGCRVVEFNFEANAGELINANFSLEGTGYYLNGIEVTSSTRYIDFEDDDGDHAAALTVRWYKTPHELAAAAQTAMRALQTSELATVTYSDTTGAFTFSCSGTVFELKWNTGTNAANDAHTKFGFADADNTAATTYTGSASTFTAPYTPTYDDSDPLAGKHHEVMIGDAADYACFGASVVQANHTNTRKENPSLCAESGISGSIITERSGSIQVTALIEKYQSKNFERFRTGATIRFQYSFGTRTGGNWNAGFCGGAYYPSVTITEFQISDDDGLATLSMTLEPFVDDDGLGEMYWGAL